MYRRKKLAEGMTEKQRAAQEGGTETVVRSDWTPPSPTTASDSRQAARGRDGGGVHLDDAPRLTSFVPVDADRRVAHVEVGPFRIGSLWVVGCASGQPTVSWPRTSRGYPIIEVEDPLRSDIEALVLAAERGDQVVPPQPRRRRAR